MNSARRPAPEKRLEPFANSLSNIDVRAEDGPLRIRVSGGGSLRPKPVAPQRLGAAVAKLKKARQARRDAELAKRADETRVLRLETGARTLVIRVDAIVAPRAEGDYANVLTEKMPAILAGQSLGKIEAMLPGVRFVRLGRSLIVDIERLREIETIDRDVTRIRLDGCAESFLLGRSAAARLKKRCPSGCSTS